MGTELTHKMCGINFNLFIKNENIDMRFIDLDYSSRWELVYEKKICLDSPKKNRSRYIYHLE